MPKRNDKFEQQLSRVLGDVAENSWSLKDDELKQEAQDLGIDVVAVGDELRNVMLLECKRYKQQKLVAARAAYEEKRDRLQRDPLRVTITPHLKSTVWAILVAQPQLQAMTVKFRNLDEVTDADFEGMLRQLISLGLIDQKVLVDK